MLPELLLLPGCLPAADSSAMHSCAGAVQQQRTEWIYMESLSLTVYNLYVWLFHLALYLILYICASDKTFQIFFLQMMFCWFSLSKQRVWFTNSQKKSFHECVLKQIRWSHIHYYVIPKPMKTLLKLDVHAFVRCCISNCSS